VDRGRGRAASKSSERDAGSARLIGRQDGTDSCLRRVLLAGTEVDYRLIRARRQSIGMTVDHSGLIVRAPRWVTIREIELALKERERWIIEMLAEWRGRNRDSLPTEWHQGAPLLFQGRALTLALFPARSKAIAADLLHLTVLHPDPADESEIAAFCRRWLKEQAFALLAPRALHFARRLRTRPPAVKLSDARSQWGSCNHRGEIRLNWRLVQLPPRIADYVVAHEVAHLVELNHSARFWALVESLLPGHVEARRELDALTPLLD
jgi:predicted metal-dependent hydrolase